MCLRSREKKIEGLKRTGLLLLSEGNLIVVEFLLGLLGSLEGLDLAACTY